MVNISDKQVVDTGAGPEGRDYRVPEVRVSGVDLTTKPTDSSEEQSPGTFPDSEISVPRNLMIESQTVRIQPDGSAVVDVLISYDESEGAQKHEVRMSKT